MSDEELLCEWGQFAAALREYASECLKNQPPITGWDDFEEAWQQAGERIAARIHLTDKPSK